LQSYGQGDYAPTDQDLAVLAELSAELEKTLDKLKKTFDVDLPELNNKLKAAGLPEVRATPVVQADSRN
jgi:endonuclease III